MSNNYQNWDIDEDFDNEDEQAQPRMADPNDLVKKLRKAQSAAEKRNKELEAELNSLRSVQRESTVKTILAERGLNPKVAKFIPADLDPSADALAQWIEENGDVFGIPSTRGNEIDPNVHILNQMDNVTSTAQTPAGADDMFLRLNQAASAEDIINMIYSADS